MEVLDEAYESYRRQHIDSLIAELKRHIDRSVVKRTGDLTVDRIIWRLIRTVR